MTGKIVTAISTQRAPKPGGHYSQAVHDGDLLFVSGQLPIALEGSRDAVMGFEDQTRLALDNMLAIVTDAGSDLERVLKVTAYIVGIENWPLFNTVFADVFGIWRPARAVVPVPALHYGYLIELEAVASMK